MAEAKDMHTSNIQSEDFCESSWVVDFHCPNFGYCASARFVFRQHFLSKLLPITVVLALCAFLGIRISF
jgi:hypothetical protein